MNDEKIKVLMCGSALTNGGGVVAVTKNLLEYPDWGNYEITYVPTHVNGTSITKIVFLIKAFWKISCFVKYNTVSIAHLHTCDGGPFFRKGIILRYLKRRGVKVVLHHHTDYTEFFGRLNGIKRIFAKRTLRLCDVNVVLGNNLISNITDLEHKAKVSVVYNGVNPRPTRQYNVDGHYILFMGWLLERKGVLDLINAIKSVDDSLDEKYKIALCGTGNLKIISQIKSIGIDNRIEYMGWVDREKKESLFKEVILNVLPSYREAAPMTILETMAYGIPSIATSISVIPEIISDRKTGILLKDHDTRKMGEVIEGLISNTKLREEISKNSYCKIKESFDVRYQVEAITELYNGLI